MQNVIKIEEKYYILATTARISGTSSVLKDGDTFAVFDPLGDIVSAGLGEQGLYHDGTRFLSNLQLRLNADRPLLLSSRTSRDNLVFGADLTNADIVQEGEVTLHKDVVHIFRSRFLKDGVAYERVRLANYSGRHIRLTLGYDFDADFADIFEVRGTERVKRGVLLSPKFFDNAVELSYRGLDDVVRSTRLEWSVPPDRLTSTWIQFEIELRPQETLPIELMVACEANARTRTSPGKYDDAFAELTAMDVSARVGYASIQSSNHQFNEWLTRSMSDVRMMITNTPAGQYPYAGVPWFNTAFGRDGIITALQLLWINPSIAAGVLRFLAETQATALVPEQDAEPGKILHETRGGEMAALHEVPFGRYYGSIDSTPLFVLLAGAYFERTADRTLLDSLWGNIEAAIGWIDQYGDRDGDGFVEYARRTSRGLVQQGWKDSHDSVFHANGDMAEPPIALSEVQAYVYGARKAAAMLARARGDEKQAAEQEAKAERLRVRFEEAFWIEDLGTYALALDGDKRPCKVRSSNAGHCLLTGIASAERARRVAASLLDQDLFSGWGVRTLAAGEARYNPMSYHNGSVWPHDNSLIAAGCARYGFNTHVQPILSGLFEASLYFESHRLPELFCGFHRRSGEGPTNYPVACSPQAWAAGSAFLLLQSALGLTIDAPARRIHIAGACLPDSLDKLMIRDLMVRDDARVDLAFERHDDDDVGVRVLKRDGQADVIVTK